MIGFVSGSGIMNHSLRGVGWQPTKLVAFIMDLLALLTGMCNLATTTAVDGAREAGAITVLSGGLKDHPTIPSDTEFRVC
jgi:hypothetical protein